MYCILWLARSSRCTTGQMLQPHKLYSYRVAVCRIRHGRAVARRAWPSDRQSVGNARLTAHYLDRTHTGCGQALVPVPQSIDAPMRREQSQAMKTSQGSSEAELTKQEDRIGKRRTYLLGFISHSSCRGSRSLSTRAGQTTRYVNCTVRIHQCGPRATSE